jgi:hypothetical protein
VKGIIVGIIVGTFASLPASAQDHTDVVRAVKAQVVASGVNVDADECARFEVTKRVAIHLASEQAGLLAKPSGNNCQGYAVDIVAFPSGQIVDILGGGTEGPNTPQYMRLAPVDPGRWRAPLPIDATPTPQPSTPEPPATVEDHDAALHRLETQLEALRADLAAFREQAHADTTHVETRLNEVVDNAKQSAPGFLAALVQVLTLGAKK